MSARHDGKQMAPLGINGAGKAQQQRCLYFLFFGQQGSLFVQIIPWLFWLVYKTKTD